MQWIRAHCTTYVLYTTYSNARLVGNARAQGAHSLRIVNWWRETRFTTLRATITEWITKFKQPNTWQLLLIVNILVLLCIALRSMGFQLQESLILTNRWRYLYLAKKSLLWPDPSKFFLLSHWIVFCNDKRQVFFFWNIFASLGIINIFISYPPHTLCEIVNLIFELGHYFSPIVGGNPVGIASGSHLSWARASEKWPPINLSTFGYMFYS